MFDFHLPIHHQWTVTNHAVPSVFGILLCLSFVLQRKVYGFDNTVDVVHDLVVPKANYLITQRFEVFCSFIIIIFLLQMLTSIQFDDEFTLDADKIRDEGSNGVLSSEINAEFIIANVCPEFGFGGC